MKDEMKTAYERLADYEYKKENSFFYDNTDPDAVVATVRGKKAYETKVRELKQEKQKRQIFSLFRRNLKDRVLNYETTRYAKYFDYDLMERHPIIGGALDILMEESTTLDQNGDMLKIYSSNEKVQKELTKLFYNNLKIETSLPMWAKTMIKYGDAFIYLQLDSEEGILGGEILPTIEVERIEWEDQVDRFNKVLHHNDDNDRSGTYFRWISSRQAIVDKTEMAHFRLLSDDKNYPYGTSILDKSRMIWQNLILVEDAMRMVRLIRGMDRKVFYINVGNTSAEEQEQMIDQLINGYKTMNHVDPKTGQKDNVYNVMEYDRDFFIPVSGSNDNTKIETLNGASNIDQIGDIEYDQSQLFAALGVPKPFLGYDETSGEGKNLALQDIRFARKVNRIQQALLMELNVIAVRHLILLGHEDSIDDFELSLNNPSTQSKQMQLELLTQQVNLVKDLTSELRDGISTMSYHEAMKKVFDYSDEKIKEILYQQYFEKEVFSNIEKAPSTIQTGFFDEVNNNYPVIDSELPDNGDGDEDSDSGGGGGFGGGDFGGGDLDMGDDMDMEGDLDMGDDMDTDMDIEGDSDDGGGEDIEI